MLEFRAGIQRWYTGRGGDYFELSWEVLYGIEGKSRAGIGVQLKMLGQCYTRCTIALFFCFLCRAFVLLCTCLLFFNAYYACLVPIFGVVFLSLIHI